MIDLNAAAIEMRRLSGHVDDGVKALIRHGREYAEHEHAYRLAKARAWTSAPEGTVPQREAWVNAHTAGERKARDLAEALRQAALEALRSRRAQLSAWQSLLAAHREEAGMASYGPETSA